MFLIDTYHLIERNEKFQRLQYSISKGKYLCFLYSRIMKIMMSPKNVKN